MVGGNRSAGRNPLRQAESIDVVGNWRVINVIFDKHLRQRAHAVEGKAPHLSPHRAGKAISKPIVGEYVRERQLHQPILKIVGIRIRANARKIAVGIVRDGLAVNGSEPVVSIVTVAIGLALQNWEQGLVVRRLCVVAKLHNLLFPTTYCRSTIFGLFGAFE